MTDASFCVDCKEDFPIAGDQSGPWQMGQMRELKKAPKSIQRRFSGWMAADSLVERPYLCGNCYFDMTD